LSSLLPKKIDNLLEVVKGCIQSGRYRDTFYAVQRQKERKIVLPKILHVLNTGRHEKRKDSYDKAFRAWNYAIRGVSLNGLDLRVIISFDEERGLLIITAFYIEERR